jgi:hypothetical protein
MIRTIMIGSHVSIQGLFVRQIDEGKIAVRVGEKTFIGVPVSPRAA